MKTWIGADFHFGHTNIIKYCPDSRGKYESVSAMHDAMIQDWNSKVAPDDLVYMLGDVAFGKVGNAVNTIQQLNGRKILIIGNHDVKNMQHPEFVACFEATHQYLEIFHNDVRVVMCHFPIYDHADAGIGSVMFHGHKHGIPTGIPGRIMDVGFDATGEVVIAFDEAFATVIQQTPMQYPPHKSVDGVQ